MRPHRILGCLLALLGSLAGASCTPSFEADVHDVEITWPGLRFPGAATGSPSVTLTQSFELDPAAAGWTKQLNANVRAAQVHLHAVEGIGNLDFIDSAQVTMSDSAGTSPTAVMSFERTASSASGPDVVVTNAQPIDITKAWSSEHVRVDVTVTGTLPSRAWAIDVGLLLSGQLSYSL